MSIYRHLDVGISNSRSRPVEIFYNYMQLRIRRRKILRPSPPLKMENETQDTPNNFYDYDDEITRMMQERDAEKGENS